MSTRERSGKGNNIFILLKLVSDMIRIKGAGNIVSLFDNILLINAIYGRSRLELALVYNGAPILNDLGGLSSFRGPHSNKYYGPQQSCILYILLYIIYSQSHIENLNESEFDGDLCHQNAKKTPGIIQII